LNSCIQAGGSVLRKTYLTFLLVLIILAWPAYYLYQRQLGAIPFLLIAIFFFYMTVKQFRRIKRQDPTKINRKKKEKIKQNNR
jgi:positive regulator of sigma E activity